MKPSMPEQLAVERSTAYSTYSTRDRRYATTLEQHNHPWRCGASWWWTRWRWRCWRGAVRQQYTLHLYGGSFRVLPEDWRFLSCGTLTMWQHWLLGRRSRGPAKRSASQISQQQRSGTLRQPTSSTRRTRTTSSTQESFRFEILDELH